MRLSTRARYGMRAMVNLAQHERNGPIRLRDIAAQEQISSDYLEQIFRRLRQIGIVTSVRGPHGGFALARAARDITLWEVISALEDHVAPVPCVCEAVGRRGRRKDCPREVLCPTRPLWAALGKHLRNYLDQKTLDDLVPQPVADSSADRGRRKA